MIAATVHVTETTQMIRSRHQPVEPGELPDVGGHDTVGPYGKRRHERSVEACGEAPRPVRTNHPEQETKVAGDECPRVEEAEAAGTAGRVRRELAKHAALRRIARSTARQLTDQLHERAPQPLPQVERAEGRK